MNKYQKLLIAIIICEGAGLIGSMFTFEAIGTWYEALNKPFFNPPSWIFGPVWTTLYFLMGISLFLAYGKKKADLKWFWVQLLLNTFWSIIFFGFKNPAFAFFEIILLWFAIAFTIRSFAKVNKTSAYLLLPYFLWVGFAGFLNLSIALLNT